MKLSSWKDVRFVTEAETTGASKWRPRWCVHTHPPWLAHETVWVAYWWDHQWLEGRVGWTALNVTSVLLISQLFALFCWCDYNVCKCMLRYSNWNVMQSCLNEHHVILFDLFSRESNWEGQGEFATSQGCSRKFQLLSALPRRLCFLQGWRALRGPGWRRPAYGGALFPGLVHAGGFHQYGAALPFPQEQGERVLPEGAN